MLKCDDKIIKTAVFSIIFFSILFFLPLISKRDYFDPVHLFIALIPLIIWLIFSGKLAKVKGPGGISILLRDEAQKPISTNLTEIQLEVKSFEVLKKEGVNTLRDITTPPNALSLEVGRRAYYEEKAIKKYVNVLEKYPDFQFIIFIGQVRAEFKGLMKVTDYKAFMETEDIIQKIESGEILEDTRVIRNSIEIDSTNKQALDEMERVNINLLPVIDDRRVFVGVITQEEIVRKTLTKLLRQA